MRRIGWSASRKAIIRATICAFICLIAVVPALMAQGYKARIVGQVTDQSGNSVAGARVTATNVDTNITTSTESDEGGNYVIAQLVPGRYRVQAAATNFKTVVRSEIALQVDQSVRVDIQLEVGTLTEQVIIEDQAPVINTETPTLGEVISNQEILDIPLNGRNYLDLALLSPGVVPAAAGANPFNVNGSRGDHVNFLIDGISNVNRRGNNTIATPSIDAIQEFKIVTNSFSAEYGRLGGGVISVALKGGTNRFHGTLYEFHRNDALDARGFFDPEVPKLIRNQFGGVLNGPIIRDRTFFLFSYEGLRNRSEQTALIRVPTLAERAGIFTAAIRDPFNNNAPFPNRTIPDDRIHPIARRVLPFIPLPNREGTLNFVTLESTSGDSNNYTIKIDHQFGQSDQLSGRLVLNDQNSILPFRATQIPGFGALRDTRAQQVALSYTHTFTPTFVNEARIGFVRDNFNEHSVNGGKNTSADIGITGVEPGFGLATFTIAGFPAVGDATFLPDIWTDNEYVLSNTASLVTGGHNIRFGGDYQRSQHFNTFFALSGGQFVFQGTFSGNAFADFLLGLPVRSVRQVGTLKSYLFSNYFGLFIQDDWKVTSNLTLNLGARWDVNQPPAEKYDRWSNFIISEGGPVVSGTPGFPRSLMKTDYRNISPRLGFAYTPFGNTKTVIRGGYGIFTAFDLQQTMYTSLGRAFPFARQEVYQAIAIGNPSLSDPFPSNRPGTPAGANSPFGWDFENPTSYMQNWNLTVARQLVSDLGLEVSYVGSKGTNLSQTVNLNQPQRTPQGNIIRFPGYSSIIFQSLGANSNYHALQVSVQKRFSRGFGFRSNFTWGKAIDNASFGSNARQPQNPLDLAAERGLSEFDRRVVWSNDFVFQLPFGRGRRFGANMSRGLDAILGGWQLNGILHFYTGRPFTPSVSGANQMQGQAVRPDRLRSGELDNPTIDLWFDPTAFVPVPLNTFRFGNSGRNILTGPGAVSVNASIFKEFSMPWEGHRVQFRAEFFNLPNRANFGQPSTAIDQPTAGVIGSAGSGREIQFALKYIF